MLPLKRDAFKSLEPLRTMVLMEPDEILLEEYRVKAIEWSKLIELLMKN